MIFKKPSISGNIIKEHSSREVAVKTLNNIQKLCELLGYRMAEDSRTRFLKLEKFSVGLCLSSASSVLRLCRLDFQYGIRCADIENRWRNVVNSHGDRDGGF